MQLGYRKPGGASCQKHVQSFTPTYTTRLCVHHARPLGRGNANPRKPICPHGIRKPSVAAYRRAADAEAPTASAEALKQPVLMLNSCTSEVIMAGAPDSYVATPTLPAAGAYQLTPLDNITRRLGYTVWGIVYPGPLDFDNAKAALAKILHLYPVLAGQVEQCQDGKGLQVSWDLSVRGVEVLTATTSLTAEELMPRKGKYVGPGTLAVQAQSDLSVLDEGLPVTPEQLLAERGPLARVALVSLAPAESSNGHGSSSSSSHHSTPHMLSSIGPHSTAGATAGNGGAGGGTLLCIAAHHVLFDGGSLKRMLGDWAGLTRALCTNDSTGISDRQAPAFGRQCWDELVSHARSKGMCTSQEGEVPVHPLYDLLPPDTTADSSHSHAGSSSNNGASMQTSSDAIRPVTPTKQVFTGPRTPAQPAYPFTPAVVVHFSADHIAALKAQAMKDLAAEAGPANSSSHAGHARPQFVSSNDVVSARMWQLLSRLPTHTPGHTTRFIRVTDYRSRLGPPSHSHAAEQQQHAPALPKNAVGNWVGFTVTHPLPAAEASLGQLAAELRAQLQAHSTAQALHSIAWLDWAHHQGAAGRAWFSKTSLWAPTDAEIAATSWDISPSLLDFGCGSPIWLQRTTPTFIQNDLIIIPDMMPDEAPPQPLSGGTSVTSESNLGNVSSISTTGTITSQSAVAGSVRDTDGAAPASSSAAESSSSDESGSNSGRATQRSGQGLWVVVGLAQPDMEAFIKQGVEEVTQAGQRSAPA